jgi:hypothetical protein
MLGGSVDRGSHSGSAVSVRCSCRWAFNTNGTVQRHRITGAPFWRRPGPVAQSAETGLLFEQQNDDQQRARFEPEQPNNSPFSFEAIPIATRKGSSGCQNRPVRNERHSAAFGSEVQFESWGHQRRNSSVRPVSQVVRATAAGDGIEDLPSGLRPTVRADANAVIGF